MASGFSRQLLFLISKPHSNPSKEGLEAERDSEVLSPEKMGKMQER